eukprot:comp19368_c0_seq1/m.22323 comp19368_c0_seq1/g.22323  ORF comp19368_c0_seq1/g.22323 comp19368_c0_seq1/m.22323 type:complete len:332 (-) comp19368_c0_seq1:141-1136(-)
MAHTQEHPTTPTPTSATDSSTHTFDSLESDPVSTLTLPQSIYLLCLVDHSGTVCPLVNFKRCMCEAALADLAISGHIGLGPDGRVVVLNPNPVHDDVLDEILDKILYFTKPLEPASSLSSSQLQKYDSTNQPTGENPKAKSNSKEPHDTFATKEAVHVPERIFAQEVDDLGLVMPRSSTEWINALTGSSLSALSTNPLPIENPRDRIMQQLGDLGILGTDERAYVFGVPLGLKAVRPLRRRLVKDMLREQLDTFAEGQTYAQNATKLEALFLLLVRLRMRNPRLVDAWRQDKTIGQLYYERWQFFQKRPFPSLQEESRQRQLLYSLLSVPL